jgi:hypothetical protein
VHLCDCGIPFILNIIAARRASYSASYSDTLLNSETFGLTQLTSLDLLRTSALVLKRRGIFL